MQLKMDLNDWKDISTSPKDASYFEVMMKDGKIIKDVHWASDRSGEYQPAFEGYFVKAQYEDGTKYFKQIITPKFWRKS